LVTAQTKMHQVEVRRDFSEGLPPVSGNRNQIQQVIINLANNAVDAMEAGGGGVLTLRTELLLDRAGAWVCLKITDTGSGIPPEVMPHIFEPFFTTKPVGRGTGLGLSLVYEIIKRHEGVVEAQSRPGLTEFNVKLPVASPEKKL
jgi:signal transduction histidine kinase